jgi:hypothetical protein
MSQQDLLLADPRLIARTYVHDGSVAGRAAFDEACKSMSARERLKFEALVESYIPHIEGVKAHEIQAALVDERTEQLVRQAKKQRRKDLLAKPIQILKEMSKTIAVGIGFLLLLVVGSGLVLGGLTLFFSLSATTIIIILLILILLG